MSQKEDRKISTSEQEKGIAEDILRILWIAFSILFVVFTSAYMMMHLLGFWRIEIGGVNLDFSRLTMTSLVTILIAQDRSIGIDRVLSVWETKLQEIEIRRRRHRLMTGFLEIWFIVFGMAFAFGQANHWHDQYRYLGSLDWRNLILVYLCGIAYAIAIKPRKSHESMATPS